MNTPTGQGLQEGGHHSKTAVDFLQAATSELFFGTIHAITFNQVFNVFSSKHSTVVYA